MELILTHRGQFNFTQMAWCGYSCESRFCQSFKKIYDWLVFNKLFLGSLERHRIAITIGPCYISKAGTKSPSIDLVLVRLRTAMKRGLEILGISIVDANAKDANFLKAEQAFIEKKHGHRPKCTNGIDDSDFLTGWYLRMLTHNRKQLLSIFSLILADDYFSEESFVIGVKMFGFDLISCFHGDIRFRYLYVGPKAHKCGRPKKYASEVDFKNLNMSVFSEDYFVEGKTSFMMYSDVVNIVSLDRNVKVVIVDYEDTGKKRQARNKEALSSAFNASLASVYVVKAFASQQWMALSVGSTKTLLHNTAMVDRFIAMPVKSPNLRLNS